MNFLAHFFLAGTSHDLLIGNFIADAVKGSKHRDYPEGIRKGILMHRFIDHYTDTHPVVTETKKRLRSEFHHYAPVISDVFYDHYLAASWEKYHSVPLHEYSQQVYAILESSAELFPDKSRYMLPFMKKHDWLGTYAHIEGIHSVLSGMAQRTPYPSGMEKASIALRADYDLYKLEFEDFFPDLVLSTQRFVDDYQSEQY